jgi:hypothetical protein
MDIGRPDGMTKGIVTECEACGEGSLVVERRNGRIINSICTNITCELHPATFNVQRIVDLIEEWLCGIANDSTELEDVFAPEDVQDLAAHLFENLKL